MQTLTINVKKNKKKNHVSENHGDFSDLFPNASKCVLNVAAITLIGLIYLFGQAACNCTQSSSTYFSLPERA